MEFDVTKKDNIRGIPPGKKKLKTAFYNCYLVATLGDCSIRVADCFIILQTLKWEGQKHNITTQVKHNYTPYNK